MSERNILKLLAFALIAIAVMVILPVSGAKREQGLRQSSVPTRTPTSSSPGNGGGSPRPPTATLVPTATFTPSPTVELVSTPEGGYVPTAEPCATPPTVQAPGNVNVRFGPGLNYEIIGTMVFLETRPIVGRAAFAPWWLIQLSDGSHGWVADRAVAVQGYTGDVPLVDPPPQSNGTPTPGAEWNPTPVPTCTPLPTSTSTATVELTVVPKQTTTDISKSQPTPSSTMTIAATETVTPSATHTALVTVDPTSTSAPSNVTGTPENPSTQVEPESDTVNWILIVGVGMVVVGAVSLLLRRRST